ncbi:AbrB family transcriptional regulator [Ramlibacter sp.]|jgi:membrane AbrB-like protein|uniref:AbrB family transcriptional regulator n=1 Tax=Ramlibacter sp. TaxID=1917967 RepID=UPI00261F5522|nr:AbrB family transcriptional regulator [Ramlibacter sp.]MDB5958538.1 Ammonia monooxygenase [Ramlibacter sp.]
MSLTPTRQQLRWAFLLALSLLLSALFDAIGLPAGRLLGPMVAAIALAVSGRDVRLPGTAFVAAQGMVGCLIARGVPASIGSTLLAHWPSFLAGVIAVTVLANALGWLLSRWNVFPGDTAIWGSAPGGASAMMIMAEAHGADVRLVAFMQYLRVVCVTFTASLVSHWWVSKAGGTLPHLVPPAHGLLLPPASWPGLLATLLVGLGGAAIGVRLRLPAGGLLLPMIAGIVLQDVFGIPIELPPLLLAVAYAIVGWTIGMRFNRQVLIVTARSLHKVLASVLTLILLCGAFGAALVHWAHIDPLTAYLATSPGGADSVAIIAASSPVDVPFVLTMQVLRMLFVMATGPAIARLLARQIQRSAQ